MSKSLINFQHGISSASGKLGKFVRDASLYSKNRNEQGKILQVAVVADDGGAFKTGEFPSELAVERVRYFFESPAFLKFKPDREAPLEQVLVGLFKQINAHIYGLGLREGSNPKLSMTGVFFIDDTFHICHVGTGRVLKISGDEITQITQDVSPLAQGMKRGMSLEEAMKSRSSDSLYNYMGMEGDVPVQYIMGNILPGETLLVMTDGVSEFISNHEIKVILQSVDNIAGACVRLTSITKERGLRDNASIIAVHTLEADTDAGRSVSDIKERVEDNKKAGCTILYIFIVFAVLALIIVSVYLIQKSLKKMNENLEKPLSKEKTQTHQLDYGDTFKTKEGKAYLVVEEDSMELEIGMLNKKTKIEPGKNKYEITMAYNEVELLPALNKETYNINVKTNYKTYLEVYESTRNRICIKEDHIQVYITKGSHAVITPNEREGITQVVVKGMMSPLYLNTGKESLIIKLSPDIRG